ncbi:MAG: hypothetical protein KIT56_05320 [Gammaproteobacteria bacterium]|nr:hypothetical protein [Gammaproteobacteria bacterium]MCW5583294.1 hypothetical protein [Gammaproteobacteria bacterium]
MLRKRYQQVVYVKDTNQENGPGHASVSVIKHSEEGTQVNHTSFYPGPVGSIVNGLTLGSVPVRGELASDYKADLDEADHILVKEINKTQYKEAKNAQHEFAREVINGHHLYSVFGPLNPIAAVCVLFISFYKSAKKTAQHHKEIEGFYPPEDHTGILVFFNHHHRKAKKSRLHNCVSSTRKVLRASDRRVENPIAPTFFTNSLIKDHGFQKIEKDDFKNKFDL